jgi:hypothetical protein
MLVINTGALSSVFLTLFCLTMSRPPLQHIPVMYLMGVAVAVIMIIQETRDQFSLVLNAVVAGTMYIHLALSLLINIYATSIIALKAWCVHVTKKHFINYALIDDTMHAYIQEIPQVADGKRYRYPNPKTGNQDIGCPGEVEYDLYSDRCKFCSMYKQGLSRFLFSLQVMILASIFISFQFGFISSVFMPVAQQLIVRSTS